jgi:hypothetical protein
MRKIVFTLFCAIALCFTVSSTVVLACAQLPVGCATDIDCTCSHCCNHDRGICEPSCMHNLKNDSKVETQSTSNYPVTTGGNDLFDSGQIFAKCPQLPVSCTTGSDCAYSGKCDPSNACSPN